MKKYHAAFRPYLNDLAARSPSPGGGSAVCLFVCLGISLIEKAIQYSLIPRGAVPSRSLRGALRIMGARRKKIALLVDRDGYFFAKIMTTREKARARWLTKSEQLIVEVGKSSREVFLLAKEIESGIKKGIMSDFLIGLDALRLALNGCAYNLETNEALFGRKSTYAPIFKRYATH
ncbi:MAG: cyclodeaminase/cyclohydrolase family protein [Candidatus Omnitrophota bacterium]